MNIESKVASGFSQRLVKLMRERGFVSHRNKSGIDVAALANEVKISYEMARRYVGGLAMPRPDVAHSIAEWLRVPISDLMYGDDSSGQVNEVVLARCISQVRDAELSSSITLPSSLFAEVVATIYPSELKGEPLSLSTLIRLISKDNNAGV